jgi:hypothetical protein
MAAQHPAGAAGPGPLAVPTRQRVR